MLGDCHFHFRFQFRKQIFVGHPNKLHRRVNLHRFELDTSRVNVSQQKLKKVASFMAILYTS